jgi:hypothetical protein
MEDHGACRDHLFVGFGGEPDPEKLHRLLFVFLARV